MNSTPCRYFQTPTGCRFGTNCRFSHSASNSTASYTQTAAPCRFYASPTGCRYGKSCYYRHDDTNITTNNNNNNAEVAKEEDKPTPDITDKVIVCGYIRDLLQNKNKLYSYDNIIKLCQSFYSLIIKWDNSLFSKNMSIINNGNCIGMKTSGWASGFLTEKYFQGIHHWKFKIESLSSRRGYFFLFGLWKTKSGKPILNSFFTDKKDNGYAMNVIDGTLTVPNTPGCGGIKYAKYCKKGDVIDMYCDFDDLLLTFAINGKYYPNGQTIEKTVYKVAVTMYWDEDCIRFISHNNQPFKA